MTISDEEAKLTEEDRHSVFIGRKPIMNYVLACITLFQSGTNEVNIKARGRAVSRAIDVAEIVRRRFIKDAKIKDVKIGTEQLTSTDRGIPSNVSTIEVILIK
jgi:DNA-binding protein